MHADNIIVLKNTGAGTKVIEQGKHAELIQRDGEYAQLWKLQTKKVDEPVYSGNLLKM